MKKTDVNLEVEMVGAECKMRFKQSIEGVLKLGKEVKVSPKSHATLNKAGYSVEYFVDTVSVCIGIGKDHTAELIMTRDAWNALNDGENINITTAKEWLEKFA